jgi:hypothetical protein
MKLLRSIGGALSIALILGLLAVAAPAGAQTLNSLTMERVLVLSSAHSTLTPNLPASLLGSVTSGALEIHEQTNYNPQASLLTSTFFVLPAGSALPTSISTVPATSFLATLALSIDKTYVTSSAVQFVGTISQSSAPLFGSASYQGAPATLSFGYTKDTPPKIHDVTESIAGVAVAWTGAATATLSITQPSTGGGGGGGTGVTIVVNGATGTMQSFQTTVNQLTLDASASSSTNAGALTYTWSIPQGSPSAGISFPGGNNAVAFVQLGSGKVTYIINLTVTDATGASATSTITIVFI